MDFSKPDNARKINSLKVLSALKKRSLSRAELSKELKINKVSISEIADSLIKEGLIEESEKKATLGRPAINLKIREKSGRVVALEIRRSNIGLSVSDLSGSVLRYDRFPKDENWEKTLSSAIERFTKDSRLYGLAIISQDNERLSISDRKVYTQPSIAEARGEMERVDRNWDKTLFISWSDSIEAAYYDKDFFVSKTFSNFRITKEETLGDIASGIELRKKANAKNLVKLASDSAFMERAAMALSYASLSAVELIGAEKVVITGELSQLDDSLYEKMNSRLSAMLPEERKSVKIYRGSLGERGRREGLGIIALDSFFYHSDLLRLLNLAEREILP